MTSVRRKKDISVVSIIVLTLLVIYMISLVLPLLWSLITSLKTRTDYMDNPFGFPKTWQFKNYAVAIDHFASSYVRNGLKTAYIEDMLLNSLIYSIGGSFLGTFVTCIMAYAASRFKFKIGKIIYGIVIITMILPIVGSLPSAIQITKQLGLYDTYVGMLILQCNFLGMPFLIFYEAFKKVPNDYSEAAYVDGAGNFAILNRIMLPMVKGTFFTIMLIKFVALWNDYNITLEYTPNIKTLAYGLYEYSHSYNIEISSTPMRLAGCNVLAIPIIIVFLIFHDKIMAGYSEGGIKE